MQDYDEYSIIQLPTTRDSIPNPTTTSGRRIYGPTTILKREGPNNTHLTEFDYKPDATIDSLFDELRAS